MVRPDAGRVYALGADGLSGPASASSYAITLIPALFMTAVCSTHTFIAGEGLALPRTCLSYALGGAATLAVLGLFREMEKTVRATKRRSVQETRIAPEKCPGNDSTEPERMPQERRASASPATQKTAADAGRRQPEYK